MISCCLIINPIESRIEFCLASYLPMQLTCLDIVRFFTQFRRFFVLCRILLDKKVTDIHEKTKKKKKKNSARTHTHKHIKRRTQDEHSHVHPSDLSMEKKETSDCTFEQK